jgi:hypothetical protein
MVMIPVGGGRFRTIVANLLFYGVGLVLPVVALILDRHPMTIATAGVLLVGFGVFAARDLRARRRHKDGV